MGRPTKKPVRKKRSAGEFDLARLIAALRPPQPTSAVYSWQMGDIRAARDDQMRGNFRMPVRLAESMRTDDALFTAYENRLAPQRCLGVEIEPANQTATARSIADEGAALFGKEGVGITAEALATITGTLANHGVAIGSVRQTPRLDGSRVDFEMNAWPLEWVRFDPTLRCLVTQIDQSDPEALAAATRGVRGGWEIPIVHGDGRWVVFAKHEIEPWKQEACILPGAMIWAGHAFGIRDWAKGSVAHGSAKVMGELPEGFALLDADGNPTAEAQAYLALLVEMMTGEALAGIKPFGAKAEFITNTSTAWQVWAELISNREKAAARIYLGTDGMLGSVGGAPGVDISALFGVATTKVQGDIACIERALRTGVIEPWAAINFGSSELAPRRRYQLPDVDAQADREQLAKRQTAFNTEIRARRDLGFEVTQAQVDELAARFDVPVPTLPAQSDKAPSVTLAPTDVAKVVKVNEARASAGLGPLMKADGSKDPDGDLTVAAFAAKQEAAGQAPPPAATPTSPPALSLVKPPADDKSDDEKAEEK